MSAGNQTLDQRYAEALRRRTDLSAQIERIRGKKEAAEANLKAAEDACRSRKVDPDNIDEVIGKLETKYEQLVQSLEADLDQLEEQIAPFLGDEDEDRSSQE